MDEKQVRKRKKDLKERLQEETEKFLLTNREKVLERWSSAIEEGEPWAIRLAVERMMGKVDKALIQQGPPVNIAIFGEALKSGARPGIQKVQITDGQVVVGEKDFGI